MSTIVIDASVFVAAFQSHEPDHPGCLQLLSEIRKPPGTSVSCPSLVLPECAGAVARITGRTDMAEEVLSTVEDCPGLTLSALDAPLARDAAALATSCRLRGADAVYVAVARRLDATLITLDREVLHRAKPVVRVLTPLEWLTERAQAQQQ